MEEVNRNFVDNDVRHSEDMQDIVTVVPSWLLRWGTLIFTLILALIIIASTFVKYPDIVITKLTIQSANAPKQIIARVSGKIIKLLVKENELVTNGQPLAYIESTGNHEKIWDLVLRLKLIQKDFLTTNYFSVELLTTLPNNELGELQPFYQIFFQNYLNYKSVVQNGFLLKKKNILDADLVNLGKQFSQLEQEKVILQRSALLAEEEFEMHKKLEQKKVETVAELRQQELKYLAQKNPLIQIESAIISAKNNYASKQKEIYEIENQIAEEKVKFSQSLNSIISQGEEWNSKYILQSSETGNLVYSGTLQENQIVSSGQVVFYINPGNDAFFGEMIIPQDNMGKVQEGQRVLIKLKSYPFEEFGIINGRIENISAIPLSDGAYISTVSFIIEERNKNSIKLKPGMLANAEIITQDATIFTRILRSLIKNVST